MTRFEPRAATRNRGSRSFIAVTLAVVSLGALAYVARIVAQHTIGPVEARGLLPRWDLATHLVLGWTDYHYLVTGRIDRLIWDLWLQGYWPPAHSLYQLPFYIVRGGGMSAGLWSSLTAFALTGALGSLILWRQWGYAPLPASIFLALLMSSPYILAYASVAMTEMPGALAELLVVLCYAAYRDNPGVRWARAFAISLAILFFTKYNYFLLLIAPLVVFEWLERTSSWRQRLAASGRWMRRVIATPTGVGLALYVVFLAIIMRSGGFDFHVLGRRISVHSIGNTGYVVLYFLLARLVYLHRRGRIAWGDLIAADPRVRPLLIWFAVPVTIWFAIPYPNHIRDFANLVLNRPLGEAATGGGAAAYLDVLRRSYFYNQGILVAVLAVFTIAALQYRRQPSWTRWLIVAVPMQFAAIAIHQTRFPRFLLLTVVLLCLVAASEAGRWLIRWRALHAATGLAAAAVLALGTIAARTVVSQQRFEAVAFENYTDSSALRSALASIRTILTASDRLAIVGESNDLSPALFRWVLGPPSGLACFPFQIGGAGRLDPALATRVLLIEPMGSDPGFELDETEYYRAQRQTVLDRTRRGELVLRREIPIQDMRVALRLYDRASSPERLVPCD